MQDFIRASVQFLGGAVTMPHLTVTPTASGAIIEESPRGWAEIAAIPTNTNKIIWRNIVERECGCKSKTAMDYL